MLIHNNTFTLSTDHIVGITVEHIREKNWTVSVFTTEISTDINGIDNQVWNLFTGEYKLCEFIRNAITMAWAAKDTFLSIETIVGLYRKGAHFSLNEYGGLDPEIKQDKS